MQYKEIHNALKEAGYTWNSAAEVIGKAFSTLHKVAKRDLVSRHVAMSICVLIDKDIMEVFPDVPEYHGDTPQVKRQKLIDAGKEKLKAAGLAA